MCEMSQLVLGSMAKGHELSQQLLHSGIGSRTLSLPLYYILLLKHMKSACTHCHLHLHIYLYTLVQDFICKMWCATLLSIVF